MSKFGIRKRLKGLVKQALGVEESPPAAPPAAPVRKAEPPPAPKPPPPAPKPPPQAPPPEEPAAVPDEGGRMWVQAGKAAADEIIPGTVHQVEVFGKRYAVYNVDGEFFASSDACPHAGGPLGEGDLVGHTITCPFHSFEFDVSTGECKSGAELSLRCVAVKVKKNRVLLEVTP